VAAASQRDRNPAYRKYVPFLDSNYNLYLLLYLTQSALFDARYREIRGTGITSMELALLTVVDGLGDKATPAEIARWMMRRRPTVTGLLDRMERNGLVQRSAYRGSRKSKLVTMTDKGRKALDTANQKDVWKTIIGAMPDEEYRQLWSLLEKLKDAAQAHPGEPGDSG
jgi:DNA-binding MarR family transcriptional regulator